MTHQQQDLLPGFEENEWCKICCLEKSKYSCPRCNLPYCSVKCYKSQEHSKCNDSFVEAGLAQNLKEQKPEKEARKLMQDILRRFNDVPDRDHLGAGKSTLGFLGEISVEKVESMSVEELVALMGPEALERFENDLRSNPKFIEAALQQWRPWWVPPPKVQDSSAKPNQDAVPEVLEELPPLETIARERPPEMLWNNLVELAYLYVYFSRMYVGDLLVHATEFAKDFLTLSNVLSLQNSTYSSVIHALRAAEAAVVMESATFMSQETKITLLDDVLFIIAKPRYILAVLADSQRIFERSINAHPSFFFAAKKLYFYNVWLNDEMTCDTELVEIITTSMCALVTGYKDRCSSETPKSDIEIPANQNRD